MKANNVFKLSIVPHTLAKFVWFVMIYMICSTFLYPSANSDMAYFSAGAGMLSGAILWQGLALCFLAALIDILFLTDRYIRNLSGIWRYLIAYAGTSAVIIAWVCIFQWLGTDKSSYVLFAVVFLLAYAASFFLGIWLSVRLETRAYNKLLANFKSNIKGEETDES